jgi:transposase
MSALSAIKHNPVIKTFYDRLIASGKAFKVAITACMRKLLVILNAKMRDFCNYSGVCLVKGKRSRALQDV